MHQITPCYTGGDAGKQAGGEGVTWDDRHKQKACLERYRRASAEIVAVFHSVLPAVVIEKASIDEAYLDVTQMVDQEMQVAAMWL